MHLTSKTVYMSSVLLYFVVLLTNANSSLDLRCLILYNLYQEKLLSYIRLFLLHKSLLNLLNVFILQWINNGHFVHFFSWPFYINLLYYMYQTFYLLSLPLLSCRNYVRLLSFPLLSCRNYVRLLNFSLLLFRNYYFVEYICI